MDYSKFVYAVQENHTEQINTLVPVITGVLIKFLKVRYDASHQDAEDCAQSTLMLCIEKIKEDKINNPDTIIYYLFKTARNEYLKVLSKQKDVHTDLNEDEYFKDGDQLNNLLEAERQKILRECMNSLKKDFKEYIQYWFNHPRDEAKVVADHFGITVNNAWTKKHRILKLLKDCCQKKLTL